LVAGLRGDLTENWAYDLSYQYSFSDGDYRQDVIFADSIEDQWFNTGSCVGQTTSVRDVPCIDVPWLDPELNRGNVSPEVADFLFGSETGNTEYTQWSVEGFVSGNLFEMPAGTAAAAIGFQFIDDEIRDVPGAVTLESNAWGASEAGITAGDQSTTAIFAEVELPLLADRTMFEDLTLTVSGRYTDVDTYGDGTTYKAGINWQMTDSWRMRFSQGSSFRTPALFELYLADETSFIRQKTIDPCIRWEQAAIDGDITQEVADNCQADGVAPDHAVAISGTSIAGGGLGILEAETSTSRTIGFIWEPEFTELSVSVDYFDIEVEDEISQLGARNIVYGCYQSDFFPNEPLCDLFERRAIDNGVDNVRDSFINVATQQNRGWDIAAVWRTEFLGGSLTFDTQHTIQTEDKVALFADNIEDTNGEFGEPKWVGRLHTTYDRGPWSFFWSADYIDSVSNVKSFGGNTATYRGEEVRVVLDADSVMYHAFSVTRYFDDLGITAVLGIANAFDEEPPQVTTLNLGEINSEGRSAFYSQYDWLGRRFYANLIWNFDR
jgi:iron complex outermembrane receptor protein